MTSNQPPREEKKTEEETEVGTQTSNQPPRKEN